VKPVKPFGFAGGLVVTTCPLPEEAKLEKLGIPVELEVETPGEEIRKVKLLDDVDILEGVILDSL
jgi:hypothetical protein